MKTLVKTYRKKTILNQHGQASIEMVLMVVVMVAMATLVSQAFRQNEYFATMVSGPWKSLSGLIQNGVWGSPETTSTLNPNRFSRVNTVRGDELK